MKTPPSSNNGNGETTKLNSEATSVVGASVDDIDDSDDEDGDVEVEGGEDLSRQRKVGVETVESAFISYNSTLITPKRPSKHMTKEMWLYIWFCKVGDSGYGKVGSSSEAFLKFWYNLSRNVPHVDRVFKCVLPSMTTKDATQIEKAVLNVLARLEPTELSPMRVKHQSAEFVSRFSVAKPVADSLLAMVISELESPRTTAARQDILKQLREVTSPRCLISDIVSVSIIISQYEIKCNVTLYVMCNTMCNA
jgi:hypothetical protein